MQILLRTPAVAVPVIAAGAMLLPVPARATDHTWTGGVGATWHTTDVNWTPSAANPWTSGNGPTNIAYFTNAATPNVSGMVYAGGITFENNNAATITNGTITLAGGSPAILFDANNRYATINSILDGSNGFTFRQLDLQTDQTRRLTLNGTNTYTGVTTIDSDYRDYLYLRAGNPRAFGPPSTASLGFGARIGQERQVVELYGNDITVVGLNSPNGNDGGGWGAFGSFVINNSTTDCSLTVSNTADCAYRGFLGDVGSGKLGLIKDGPAALYCQGWNTYSDYSGGLTIRNGTMQSDRGGNVWGSGRITMGGGGTTGTLEMNHGSSQGIANAITLASGGTGVFLVSAGAGVLTLSGVVDGDGGLTKTGAGKLTLSNAANNWGGNTTVSNGTLRIDSPFLADFADVYMVTGGVLNLDFTGTDTIGGLFFNGADQGLGAWGAVGSGADNESALFTGTGILRIPATYNWTGVTDSAWDTAGNWEPNGVPGGGAMVVFPQSGNYRVGAAVEWEGAKTVWMIRFDTTTNTVTLGPDAGSETVTVDVVEVTATSVPDYEIKADVSLSQDLTVINASTSSLLTISGAISGSYHVDKTGPGTLVLAGANTYTGITTVGEGTLALGPAGSIDNSAGVSIATNATFDVTNQSYVMSGSQTITFDIDPAGPGAAGTIDATNLDISAGVVVLNVNGTLDDSAYVLATYTSLTGDEFADVTGLPAGYGIRYIHNGGTQIALAPLTTLTWCGPPGGTWDTTDTNWTPPTTDPWISGNGSANVARFTNAATPNVTGTVYANGMTFTVSGTTITNGIITLAGESPAINFTGTCDNATIDSVLAGNSGLTFSQLNSRNDQQRRLTLNGSNNYSGVTWSDGIPRDYFRLRAGNSQAFGPPDTASLRFSPHMGQNRQILELYGNDITVIGADYTSENDGGHPAFGAFIYNTGANDATLTVNTVSADSTCNVAFRDEGAGALALAKDGPYQLTLRGNNTYHDYSGGLTIKHGTVSIDGIWNGVLGTAGIIMGESGKTGTLKYNEGGSGTTTAGNDFTLATGGTGAFEVVSSTRTLNLAGVIDGAGSLGKTGAGTLKLSTTNTFSGSAIVTVGALDLAVTNCLAASESMSVYGGATCRVDVGEALNDGMSVSLYSAGGITGRMDLAAGTTNTVLGLFFDGVKQNGGTWGASGTGADNINDDYFTGSGVVKVGDQGLVIVVR